MKIDGIESISSLAGFNMMTDGSGASFGMSTINLKDWSDRKKSVNEIIDTLIKSTKHINDATIQFFPPPAVPGFGNASGFEMQLLDRTRTGNLERMAEVTKDFIKELKKRPEIRNVFTSFDPSFPQYMIHVDFDAAARKSVNVEKSMENLQALIGSYYVTNFIRFGQLYKVMLQAHPRYRALPGDLLKLTVKNNEGEMVPYSAFCKMERVFGPEQWTRYNMYTSAMLNGEPAEGYSTGDAIDAITEVAGKHLPKGFSFEWYGMTKEEVSSGNQVIYIFSICLLFVYLLLAAQYESFLLPFPVLLSLPAGIFGSFLFLMLFGLENNIYAQVSMVMLIGLLGKNAILIVEYAAREQRNGCPAIQAAMDGAVARIRPILMTSFAFIAGLMPLILANGAGAIGNKTIGTAAAGGMLVGTLCGTFIIPGLYLLFAKLQEKTTEGEVQKQIHF
jgi:HAE1 family hydrophobic/amphiphilic exporter-1